MKILVFDVARSDDSVCEWLRGERHEVRRASDAVEVGLLDMAERFDLIVVTKRSRGRITQVISDFWAERIRCPVVLLPDTAVASAESQGRLRRALVSISPTGTGTSHVKIGDLVVDTANREAYRAGERIALTRREYDLLELLATNVGRVLSREAIQLAVWGDDYAASNTVDVHIAKLRKKVDEPFGDPLIRTVIGFGYVLRETEET